MKFRAVDNSGLSREGRYSNSSGERFWKKIVAGLRTLFGLFTQSLRDLLSNEIGQRTLLRVAAYNERPLFRR